MDSGVNYKELLEDGAILIDVRSAGEYARGCLPNAISIPIGMDFGERTRELVESGKVLIVYCVTGARSSGAKRRLLDIGAKEVYNLGSFSNYESEIGGK